MNDGHTSAQAARMVLDNSFQRLLLDFSTASRRDDVDEKAVVSLFCRKTRDFFGVSRVTWCKLLPDGTLQAEAATDANVNETADQPACEQRITKEAIQTRRTTCRNQASASNEPTSPASLMATPVIITGEVAGAISFAHDANPECFTNEMASQATVLGFTLGGVLESLRLRQASRDEHRRAENLVAIALELNTSLRLTDFVHKFTARAAALLDADSALLALSQASMFETVAVYGDITRDPAILRPLSHASAEAIRRSPEDMIAGDAAALVGQNLASSLKWRDVVLTKLTGAAGELIGILCLANRGLNFGAEERKLLQALCSHASVALENSRLFTRMDQANRHWMDIFDAITDFIVVHDEAKHVLRVNRSFADFIGVRPSELIGMSMRALSMGNDADAQPCPFCRAGLDSADEYIHPLSEHTYLISTSRNHGPANESLQTIHVLKDITDRREAERRYRELFDNIQEGLYFSSPEGRFIEVNDALVRMLGYVSREELLRVDIPTQLHVSPECRELLHAAMKTSGVVRNFESVVRRKDGGLLHTLQNAFAVKDAQGRILQYRGLISDITELKNFQAELQRERDFSSKILNNTQSLILVVDTAGLISYANRRCYQPGNYKDSTLLGRPVTDLVLPNRRAAVTEALDATLQGSQVDNLELPLVLASGRVAQFSINLSPMRDEQGNVTSIVVVMTDITDAAMLQAKLMHTEKMAAVGQLVSGVAHEVNNPLTAVLGFTDLLLESQEVPESARKDLRIILQEAQRTKQIVQNLLSFARQTPPKRQAVYLNEVVRRTLALRSYDLSNRDIKVVEKLDENLPHIIGDAHQLQQVFLNIINNAYDALCEAGRPGRLDIETKRVDQFAEVCFRDNGNGIQHPERIFDPFFTTKEVGKGTGLGLSICYGIVHEHGGDIFCFNNQGPDAPGASFVIRLPLSDGNQLAQS